MRLNVELDDRAALARQVAAVAPEPDRHHGRVRGACEGLGHERPLVAASASSRTSRSAGVARRAAPYVVSASARRTRTSSRVSSSRRRAASGPAASGVDSGCPSAAVWGSHLSPSRPLEPLRRDRRGNRQLAWGVESRSLGGEPAAERLDPVHRRRRARRPWPPRAARSPEPQRVSNTTSPTASASAPELLVAARGSVAEAQPGGARPRAQAQLEETGIPGRRSQLVSRGCGLGGAARRRGRGLVAAAARRGARPELVACLGEEGVVLARAALEPLCGRCAGPRCTSGPSISAKCGEEAAPPGCP